MNRTGKAYIGSYDIWTRNQITHLLDILSTRFTTLPADSNFSGWVNGNQYERSTEVFGILPLPQQTRVQLGLLDFHPLFAKKHDIKHAYLAQQQNARTAVLPVHTKAERWLFAFLVSETHGLFSGLREPDWGAVAARWAAHADGKTIFYKVRQLMNLRGELLTWLKLPEHLKSYWKKWQENVNEKNSIKINERTYNELIKLLNIHTSQNPFLSVPAAQPVPLRKQITSGKLPETQQNDYSLEPWHVMQVLDHHTAAQSAVQFSFGESGATIQRALAARYLKGKKRALPEDIVDQPRNVVQKREPRTCPRCKKSTCNGRFNSRPCS